MCKDTLYLLLRYPISNFFQQLYVDNSYFAAWTRASIYVFVKKDSLH